MPALLCAAHGAIDRVPVGRDLLQGAGRRFRGRLEAADYRLDFHQARLKGSEFVRDAAQFLSKYFAFAARTHRRG
jgi:hypothetical protein